MGRHIWEDNAQQTNGNALTSATVTVYLANTTTLASIYSAVSGGSAITGSYVTTDSTGKFTFYIDDDDYQSTQRFKYIITKTGYTSQTRDYLEIIPESRDNVKNYGALGDGSTDDLTAIQAAIDAKIVDGGGIVFFPQGTYMVSATLTMDDLVHLKGAGEDVSIIKASAAITRVINFPGTDADMIGYSGISDITISGGGTVGSAAYANLAIEATEIFKCTFVNVRLVNSTGTILKITDSWDCRWENVTILYAGSSTAAMVIFNSEDAAAPTNGQVFDNLQIEEPNTGTLRLIEVTQSNSAETYDNRFDACKFHGLSNDSNDYLIDWASGTARFDNCYFTRSDVAHVNIASGAVVKILGSDFINVKGKGILTAGNNGIFVGNTLDGASAGTIGIDISGQENNVLGNVITNFVTSAIKTSAVDNIVVGNQDSNGTGFDFVSGTEYCFNISAAVGPGTSGFPLIGSPLVADKPASVTASSQSGGYKLDFESKRTTSGVGIQLLTTDAGGTGTAQLSVYGGSDSNIMDWNYQARQGGLALRKLTSEPSKIDGSVAYADGSGWDPGAGVGMYWYNGAAWIPFTSSVILLSSTASCDLDAANGTEKSLYTVPTGRGLVVNHIVMRAFSAACGTAVVTFGKTGGTCDEFLGNQTLTNISGTGDYLIVSPIPNATPPKAEFFTAGQVFAMEITTKEGSALTCTVDVFGYLY